MAANRKLGCLSIFLFVALCASVLVNFILATTAFRKFEGSGRDVEYRPRFREMIVERGARGNGNKIAVISLRGLISTSVGGNVGESMVDDCVGSWNRHGTMKTCARSCSRSIRPAAK